MLKKLLCLLLALMMVVSLMACDSGSDKDDDDDDDEEVVDEKDKDEDEDEDEGEDKDDDTGKNDDAVVAADPLSEKILGTWVTYLDMATVLGEQEGFETDVQLPVVICFEEDGSVEMAMYEDEAEDAVAELEKDLTDFLIYTMYAEMESAGYSQEETDELFEDEYGMSVEEYCAAYIEEMDLYNEFAYELENWGDYEVDDDTNTLYIDGEAMEVEIDGDELTIVSAEDEEYWEDMGFRLPQTFTRIDD